MFILFFFCAADVCWAIVVSELIRAMRIIDGRQTDKTIRYSPQDLIDFSDKDKRRTEQKSGHYCYTLNLIKGMEYVVENGIQREEDRPFKGCPENVAERKPSEFAYIEKFVRLRSLEDALLQLAHHPIGAALAMFQPEYREIGKKVNDLSFFFLGLSSIYTYILLKKFQY